MPTVNLKPKLRRAANLNLFPHTDARVERHDFQRPPVDRMLREDRRNTKQKLREFAERLEHSRD